MYLYQKVLCIFLFAVTVVFNGNAQTKDSLPKLTLVAKKDTTKPKLTTPPPNKILDTTTIDSLPKKDSLLKADSILQLVNKLTANNNGYGFLREESLLNNEPFINKIANLKPVSFENNYLFYLLVFIVLILAIIKLAFPKHLTNIFSIFFQTNYRQRQTKDQLLQDKLAHVGLMLVFVCSAAAYISILLHNNKIFSINFWQLLGISSLLLIIIYGLKYLFIQLLGVLFKQQEASTTYIFLVFLINKLLGVLLIPAIVLISFSTPSVAQTALTISYITIVILLLYRVFLTYKSVSNRLNVNILQFFLYFCGIEILPLLLIYKVSLFYL